MMQNEFTISDYQVLSSLIPHAKWWIWAGATPRLRAENDSVAVIVLHSCSQLHLHGGLLGGDEVLL